MEMHITKENVEVLLYWMENKCGEELKKSNYYILQERFLHADKYWPLKDRTTKEEIIEKLREHKKYGPKNIEEEKRFFDENMEDIKKFSKMSEEEIRSLDEFEMSLYEDSYLTVLDFANSIIRLVKETEFRYMASMERLTRERDNLEPTDEVWEKIITEVRENNKQEKFDFGEEYETLYNELFVSQRNDDEEE